MSHIYICYSRPNKSYADYLADDLRRRGFDVWIDERTNLDKQHLLKIVQAIQECDAFVLVYSAIAEESNLVQRETDFALHNEKPFYTLMLEGEAEGADSYDVGDGSLPSAEFYDSLKHYVSVKTDTVTADDLFEEDEDLFGDLDIDSIEPIVRDDELLSFDEFDMDDLLDNTAKGDRGQKGGKRRRGRLLLGGVGFVILLLLLAVAAVILQQDDEPKVAENTAVSTATDVPTESPTLEPSETPLPATATLEPSETPRSTATHTPVPSLTPLPFWFQPVLANEDWIPISQEFDGVSMVLVPPGCFTMGSSQAEIDLIVEACSQNLGGCSTIEKLGEDAFLNEMPPHDFCFTEPFWIDQYEVTNGQIGSNGYITRNEQQPHDGLSEIRAIEHCESRGTRLPTEAEWEFAAKGPSNWLFPWGEEYQSSMAVSRDGTSPLPKEVGSIESSTSWIGAYDMSGNVWEWTSTIYLPYPYVNDEAHENPEDLEALRVLRGGSLFNRRGELRTTMREFAPSDSRESGFGVRCARDFVEGDIAE